MNVFPVILGLLFASVFCGGACLGYQIALAQNKRIIKLGQEHQHAIDKALRGVGASHRVELAIHARIAPVSERKATSILKIIHTDSEET